VWNECDKSNTDVVACGGSRVFVPRGFCDKTIIFRLHFWIKNIKKEESEF